VYNLLPITYDKNFKVLNISHHLGYAEAYIYKYINQTSLENINTNIDSLITGFVFGKNFKEDEIKTMNRIYKYENYKIISKCWTPSELDKIITDNQSSKDLCFLDCHMFIKGYETIRINYNHQLLLGGLILALSSLKQNGKLLLSLAGLSSKFSQDLLVIVNQYFDKMVLFKHELYNPHYNTYFIACYGFRNKAIDNFTRDIEMMTQIYQEMYNLDKTGGFEYTSNDPTTEKALGIKKTNPRKTGYTYFNSLLEPNGSLLYNLITKHIEDRLRDYSQFLDAMDFYYDHIRLNREEHQKYQMINYYKSIQLANYLNLAINPVINIFKIKTNITTDIYQNLYGLDTTVHFKFRAYPNNKLIYGKPKLELSNQNLLEQILKMNSATRLFDTRKLDNYDLLKKKVRFYENSLNGLLMENFNTGIPTKKNKVIRQPSRAWIKMYEIADIAQLIPRHAPKFKVLCFCEAPGNFILAINHYVKTKTEIKKFDWIAQSYNPNAQGPRDYHVIGDDYELMAKYPNNWDFGPKNTGDITDATNIKYYGTIYNDVDLLTADCGTDWGDNDLFSSKLMYGQLLFILNSLPVGKSFVIKYYVPFIHYPAQLALFYIIYQSFEEISFYKPLQNAWSPEFYLIGKNYKGINQDLLAHLFDILNNYNPYLSPIDLQKLPMNFSLQLEKVVQELINRFVFYIERYIYYIDIIEEGGNPRFNLVEQHINLRNEEWVKKFKILKIKDADKL
jgi:23S rRNA U2552 (ribose-2'-O)-methylase RlmE/FtsJ